MTTIAANRKAMACDLQFTHRTGVKLIANTKIVKLKKDVANAMLNVDKAYIGAAGDAISIGRAWMFLDNPAIFDNKVPKIKNCEFIALTKDGIATSIDLRMWFPLEDDFYAIGTGAQYAMGAMAAGKSPKDAILVATEKDIYTGMGVKNYKL